MKVITFGEIMLRLCPGSKQRLFQQPTLNATFGGGEVNVAVSLANYKNEVEFVTKLPENEIADVALAEIRGLSVGTKYVARGGDRMGLYYLEAGASLRPSKVIYDRAHSAISEADESDFDWDKIFEGADWFHFTGITPALSVNIANITETALKKAKAMGLTVSCDLNYRKKLWSKKAANETMTKLMQYVDVLIANESDAADVFNIVGYESDVEKGQLNKKGFVDVAKKLYDKFGFKGVAITLRESFSADDNDWSAMYYTAGKATFSTVYHLRIVDRVGAGDSFAGGLIHGLRAGLSTNDALEFAVAASALKHTVEGDYNRVSIQEVQNVLNGSTTGRVMR